ncbi:MAG: hypothetical protein WC975_04605 [Phycisphaerae bacterium]
MINICVLGSSTGWTPGLVTDLMCVFDEPMEIRLIDINPKNAILCKEWCDVASKHHGRKDKAIAFSDRRKALKGADVVIITLSTGGLNAMKNDLAIPEKYGIYGTVGDTSGPGGWSRSIRNIPIFMEFAKDFAKLCPTAFIANYTNPMSSLTATLALGCPNPVVGLCHAYFETKDVIQKIFGLKDWSKLSLSIAGMNHFTWVVDFNVGKDDGYKLLRKKVGKGSLHNVLPKESKDEIGYSSRHALCVEFYDAFGYLPYPADRHTSEFVSFTLTGKPGSVPKFTARDGNGLSYETFKYCNIKRTTIEQRRWWMPERNKRMLDMISGKAPMPAKSRETVSEMLLAYLRNQPFTESVNTLNIGQISGLPLGCCVETLGVVDGLGVRPLMVPNVPEHLLEIMRPQAVCQKWITQGMIEGKKDLLFQALYRDPQCAHLKPHEIRALAAELFAANKPFLPPSLR